MTKRNPNSKTIKILPATRKIEGPRKLPPNLYERPIQLPPMKPIHAETRKKQQRLGFLADDTA